MGGTEFVILRDRAINMAQVQRIEISLDNDHVTPTALGLFFVNSEEMWIGGDEMLILLKWLREYAARYPHLSLDLDAASMRSGGDG
jgi:hypothetical protein